jgi:SHS2 domain-containing protein
MLFQRFKVRIHRGHLRAVAWGEPMDAAHQRRAAEVKSADLHDVRVERDTRGQWVAEAIIDA